MIKLNNVSKSYKKKKNNLIILKNLNYNFKRGKLYCIIGRSGVGKTTLIQMLGLLLESTSGDIYIEDKRVTNLTDNEKSSLRNKKIGFIFQNYYLNPFLKAYENVMLPCYLDSKDNLKNKKEKALKLLKELGLENRMDHYPKELSGGESQRVAIARALINNPDIILADEPTGALDKDNEKVILEILKKLSKEGKCIILVSHNDVVKNYADTVLCIKENTLFENSNLNED